MALRRRKATDADRGQQQREAAEFTALLSHVVAKYQTLAKRPDFQKAMLKIADELLTAVDGQTKTELQTAKANLAALA